MGQVVGGGHGTWADVAEEKSVGSRAVLHTNSFDFCCRELLPARPQLGLVGSWLPEGSYSGSLSCYPKPPLHSKDGGSFIFTAGGASQKQVVGALPPHRLCHLPGSVVTE